MGVVDDDENEHSIRMHELLVKCDIFHGLFFLSNDVNDLRQT
jgi:hypothetical protein